MTHAKWFGVGCEGRLTYLRAEEHRTVTPEGVIESTIAVYRCGGCGIYLRRRHLAIAPPEGQLGSLGLVEGTPVNVWTQRMPRELAEDMSRHFMLPE